MTAQYGRYRIVKELGKGTMGVVYQAHDPQIDRMVALKVLRPDRVTSGSFVARFLKEARAIGRLSYANIVTIYDVGEDQGTIYIAMEYLKGEPLNEVVRSGCLTVPQCVDIARQVALTLDYAHRQGIIHRDIKPSNIIYTEEHQVKLTDFGIARIEDTSYEHQTQAGEILGTPVYMSPEQVMGHGVDGRSDLFSVGVILYEMIVGRRPFGGSNIAAIFRAITQDAPEPPTAVDPSIPKSLADLILKCLSKKPQDRFQTGAEMAEALSVVLTDAQNHPQLDPSQLAKKKLAVALAAAIFLFALGTGGFFYFANGLGVFSKPRIQDQSRMPARLPVPIQTIPTPGGNTTTVISNETAEQISSTPKNDSTPQVIPEDSGAVEMATLKITSHPEGANVFIDNALKGQTPLDLSLPLGKYELRLNSDGYLEWEAQVELDVAGVSPFYVSLHPLN